MLLLEQLPGERQSAGNLDGTSTTLGNVPWNTCHQRDSSRSHQQGERLGLPIIVCQPSKVQLLFLASPRGV